MLHFARAGRAWMAAPALAAGALLLAGSPAFAADTAPVYTVTQEGMTSAEGAKLADAFGDPELGRSQRRVRLHVAGVRAGAAEGGRGRQGRSRPPDAVAGARPGRAEVDPAAVGRRRGAAGLPPAVARRADPGPQGRAEHLPHRALALRSRGQPDRQVRARHRGLVQVHARRPARRGPGREAAHRVRRRRQRDAAVDLAAPARARRGRADHLLRRGDQVVRPAVRG